MSAKQGGFSEQNKGCSPILQMRRLSLRDEQQASRFHSLAAVQEQKLLKEMPGLGGGGAPGASTPRVLISGRTSPSSRIPWAPLNLSLSPLLP